MTPADAKDWWLAAAALSTAFVSSAQAQDKAAPTPEKAGVISAMKPGVTSATGNRVLYVGGDTYRGEKLVTDATGTLHILFMDQSSMTLGPNSEVTIDEFVYDPNSKRGKIGVSLGAGLLRVVGGQISKNTETTVKTASGTIGIRGGITTVEQSNNQTTGTFLFGQQMRATDNSGNTQTVTRAGFGITSSGTGLSSPQRVSTSTLNSLLSRFESQSGNQNTGNQQPPGGFTGRLISTSDQPNSGNQSPSQTLSGDRVNNLTSTTLQNNPSSSDARTLQNTEASQQRSLNFVQSAIERIRQEGLLSNQS